MYVEAKPVKDDTLASDAHAHDFLLLQSKLHWLQFHLRKGFVIDMDMADIFTLRGGFEIWVRLQYNRRKPKWEGVVFSDISE